MVKSLFVHINTSLLNWVGRVNKKSIYPCPPAVLAVGQRFEKDPIWASLSERLQGQEKEELGWTRKSISDTLYKRDDDDLRFCINAHGRPPGTRPAGGID